MVYNIAPKCLQKDFCNYNVRIFNGGWFYEKSDAHCVTILIFSTFGVPYASFRSCYPTRIRSFLYGKGSNRYECK